MRTAWIVSQSPAYLVAGLYLSKMDLIENDLVRVTDAKESGHECKDCDYAQCQLVVPFIDNTLI